MRFWKKKKKANKPVLKNIGASRGFDYSKMTYEDLLAVGFHLLPAGDTPLDQLIRDMGHDRDPIFKMFDHFEEMPKLTLDQQFDLLCGEADARRMQEFVQEAQEIIND